MADQLIRLEVGLRPGVDDTVGAGVAEDIRQSLDLPVQAVARLKIFTLAGVDADEAERLIQAGALHDSVCQTAAARPLADPEAFDWALEVGFKPGVTDNEGRTARETAALVLGRDPASLAVYTADQYLLTGPLDRGEVERIGRNLLANELIQRIAVKSSEQWRAEPGFPARAAAVSGRAQDRVDTIPVSELGPEALMTLSRENTWALSAEELAIIKAHFAKDETRQARKAHGLGPDPTDAEMECLAQTWSEHCKHKIFSADIDYRDEATGEHSTIKSLYKTYIQAPTQAIRQRLGEDDYCLSVFKDNAGVVSFTEDTNLCVKVETHNSPSALDPYGGALTGIVGVNRDPMGAGMGAEMVCNTDVFCFASPFHQGELPPRLLHPRRVLEGVRQGVEHGGNKSGVPTVNGSIVFHERFLGKPLVYCGTVGMMPKTVAGRPSHEKAAQIGDAVVMVGGPIGKDGIHGATFSSEELSEFSPATAVQIGDPITQKRAYDCIIRARDAGLYNAITDNGAGGLSSSVGEMAEDTGGVALDLAKAPLKYDGLMPWEILLSEAQERMTLAVPQDKLQAFLHMAAEMQVSATVLGEFTDSGFFHVTYGDKPVARLSMDFLHHGLPPMRLAAHWKAPEIPEAPYVADEAEQGGLLLEMLGRLNICSKEYVVRQYDHEVKGGSAVKPMVGAQRDGPSDAGVMRPVLDRPEGVVMSHGICPKFSDIDTYWMAANAVDEAVRNAVAVGADPDRLAGCDNFCWCDPVQSDKTPDGRYKLAQLVRAGRALAHHCLALGVPCVSGKDSMKNDYAGGGIKISIPPTLLFTVMGFVPDVGKTVTSDFKRPGEAVYILGHTKAELGGSELADHLGFSSAAVPQVDALAARARYRALHQAIMAGMVTACHDCSDGGLAVTLAEMALGGRLGADIDLDAVPVTGLVASTDVLYSESASRLVVTVARGEEAAFEALFPGQPCAPIGQVGHGQDLTVTWRDKVVIKLPVDAMARAFKATLAL